MSRQFLTFTLANTVYAANVFNVREVLPYTPPQALPNSDPVIEGLIRSRGQSIPVINLRRKFGLEDRAADSASRIIVLEIRNDEEGSISVFAAIADSVNEVLDLDSIGFEVTPELGNSHAAAFIEGIGRQGDAFIIILDVDKIFTFSEISKMTELENKLVAPEYAPYVKEEPPSPPVQAEKPPVEEIVPVKEVQEEQQVEELSPSQELSVEETTQEARQAEPEKVLPNPDSAVPLQDKPEPEPPPQAEIAKKPPQEENTAARHDALNYAPEDFELL